MIFGPLYHSFASKFKGHRVLHFYISSIFWAHVYKFDHLFKSNDNLIISHGQVCDHDMIIWPWPCKFFQDSCISLQLPGLYLLLHQISIIHCAQNEHLNSQNFSQHIVYVLQNIIQFSDLKYILPCFRFISFSI